MDEPEGTALSKIYQAEKDKYSIISFTWGNLRSKALGYKEQIAGFQML